MNIENGGQMGHLKQIMYPLVQIDEFQPAALVSNRGVSLDQFPDPRTVHVQNFAQVQDDRFSSFFRQISNNLAQNNIPLSHRNSSADVNDGYLAHLPDGSLHLDRGTPLHSNSAPIKNIRELVSYAKDQPGAMTYGSTGTGSFNHVNALLFSSVTQTKFTHVPYGQTNPLTDLVGGHIDLLFDAVGPTYLEHSRAGRLRAIAVTGESRIGLLPDVPTFIESGVPAYDSYVLFGMMAPKGTPGSIIAKMQSFMLLLPHIRSN